MHPLFEIFKKAKDDQAFQEVLDITFTDKEQEMMVERWRILSELNKGNSQREVAKNVECSVVTVTRGAKVYRDKKATIQKWLKFFREPVIDTEDTNQQL